jgi:hypothetical protein
MKLRIVVGVFFLLNGIILKAHDADWVVIGAGPAGIATVGVLLDIGVSHDALVWIDPEFNVGNLHNFPYVPANNKTKEFIAFVNACKVFQECTCPALDVLHRLDPEQHHELRVMIEPLRCITAHLRTKITALQDSLTALNFNDNRWHVGTSSGSTVLAKHVILATGSHPKNLTYAESKIVPLDVALNPAALARIITATDNVSVIGSSHSAILILKFLSELAVQPRTITNFYRNKLQYAADMGGWSTGHSLKGVAAEWAKNVLEKNPPKNLVRLYSTPALLKSFLPACSKIMYAIGFERNQLPPLNSTTPITDYNEHTGFIAPRLFGIGIAFPELVTNPVGNSNYCIGLDCFMEYAQSMIPHWMNDSEYKGGTKQSYKMQLTRLKTMANLFTIYPL